MEKASLCFCLVSKLCSVLNHTDKGFLSATFSKGSYVDDRDKMYNKNSLVLRINGLSTSDLLK